MCCSPWPISLNGCGDVEFAVGASQDIDERRDTKLKILKVMPECNRCILGRRATLSINCSEASGSIVPPFLLSFAMMILQSFAKIYVLTLSQILFFATG